LKKNVTISIDDLHPEKGWGCYGDKSVAYLKNLWEEFGCKFTLFIPSNYHGEYPLSEHKDWVNYWLEQEWVELAAHGHYHQCQRTDKPAYHLPCRWRFPGPPRSRCDAPTGR